MQELGLKDAADEVSKHNIISDPKPKKKRQEKDSDDWEPPPVERRSSRDIKRVTSYREDDYYGDALPRLYGGGGSRGPREVREVDEAGLALLREKHGNQHLLGDGSELKGNKKRGPQDSGKGVRIQGGRVYDSTFGVTCHWCRQKTLEDKVTCTSPGCGKGKRLPTTFCKMCLRNRHGEDFAQAAESGKWVCPLCRVSCGPGCVCCCNCGPCRKKAGLEPTHQLVKSAQQAGFNNAHDYLVHLVTKEDPEEIAARKMSHSWGDWLKDEEANEGEGGGIPQEDKVEEEEEEVPRDTRSRGRLGKRVQRARSSKADDEEDDIEVIQTPDASKPKRGRKAAVVTPPSSLAARLTSAAVEEEETKEAPARSMSRKERAKARLGL